MKALLGLLLLVCSAQARAEGEARWTTTEQALLQSGEVSTEAYVAGGVIGTWPGFYMVAANNINAAPALVMAPAFGLGQAIQGRYSERGWVFTAGEAGAILLTLGGGAIECNSGHSSCHEGPIASTFLGLLIYLPFRIWEIVDLWAGPPAHNREYRELRAREQGLSATIAPAPKGAGAQAALVLRF